MFTGVTNMLNAQSKMADETFCNTLLKIIASGSDQFRSIQGDSINFDTGYPFELLDHSMPAYQSVLLLPGSMHTYIQRYPTETYFESTLFMDTLGFTDDFYEKLYYRSDGIKTCLGSAWKMSENIPDIHIGSIRETRFTSDTSPIVINLHNATRYHNGRYYVILLVLSLIH